MDKNLEVNGITKADLKLAISQNRFWKEGLAPYTRSKAYWLISNERIDENEYCGVIATENKKMVAFIYLFPDILNNIKSSKTKIYWMNDWWIHNDYKESVLGSYVYNEALRYTRNQVIIKAYTENVHEFYEKQPYKLIRERLRYTLFFSVDTSMLLGKFNFLNNFKLFLSRIDKFSAYVIKQINKVKLKNNTKGLKYDYLNNLDKETWNFIQPHCKDDLIYKTKDYIDWHLNKNQFDQTPFIYKRPYTNLQPGASDNITIHKVKIILENRVIGFLAFIVNYKEFNIKYFITENNDVSYMKCVDALMDHFQVSKCNFIFTDDAKIVKHLKKRFSIIYIYKVLKKALAHKDLACDISNLQLNEQDGHFY